VNVPTPTNPKKRALMPSSPLRRRLRAAGHHLSPVVQVGKEGVTEAVLRQLDQALLDHELVKVKVGTESPEDRFEAADALLSGVPEASLAQILGRTMLVYRRHPKKPRYEPLPAPPPGERPAPRPRAGRSWRKPG
jgi:RNA-binding protein